ncbi:YdaU family protein [Massilia agilis]|uniref:YdaU family protein n=1 Tax=Massilia agilis TaxID=1811226 RepID=A0ABT2DBS6_9BURK|nr:YdaU family protein [Massilia agilis]MCS0808664.1 YdaU family protein [Massilia agilis]
MNYFELHIGDYAEATAHLSFVEDAAYIRLLRKCYATEKPLPADVKAVQRLVAARSKEERDAVVTVLNEFFTLEDDGWHNERCDAEIARFIAGEPEREIKKANEENRVKRHREERARLFKLLTEAGQHAPWNISMQELRELVKKLPATTGRATATEPVTSPVTSPVTAPATPATATQSPIPNTQTPEIDSAISLQASTDAGAGTPPERDHPSEPLQLARNVQISLLLRAQGVRVTASHPTVAVTWAQNDAVTDALLIAAVGRAKEALGKKNRSDVSIGYLEPIVAQLLATPAPSATGGKFNVAGLDHSSTTAAMTESMQRHGVTVPVDGEITFN